MKTPEEIKGALLLCSTIGNNCEGCPYKPMRRTLSCFSVMKRDSIAYIEQLEERINLMMIQMRGECVCCAYKGRPIYKSPCSECLLGENRPMWEYEGMPEVKER